MHGYRWSREMFCTLFFLEKMLRYVIKKRTYTDADISNPLHETCVRLLAFSSARNMHSGLFIHVWGRDFCPIKGEIFTKNCKRGNFLIFSRFPKINTIHPLSDMKINFKFEVDWWNGSKDISFTSRTDGRMYNWHFWVLPKLRLQRTKI